MQSDPIADLLTRIRNGAQAHHPAVNIPFSKIKIEILKILQAEGYIKGYEITTVNEFPAISVQLQYDGKRQSAINRLQRVSRPGLRIYKTTAELKPIRSGLATRIISTSQGLMTDREARRKNVGGEVLCEVW